MAVLDSDRCNANDVGLATLHDLRLTLEAMQRSVVCTGEVPVRPVCVAASIAAIPDDWEFVDGEACTTKYSLGARTVWGFPLDEIFEIPSSGRVSDARAI